jgi:putative endopeptidase
MSKLVGVAGTAVAFALLCTPLAGARSGPAAAPAGSPAAAAGAPSAAPAATLEPLSASGVELSSLDHSVDPCTDFYRYACGGWMAKHPVPADRPTWSRFSELADSNRRELHSILEADSADRPGRTADERKLGDFYSTCMDEPTADRLGIAPIQEQLGRIAALASPNQQLAALVADLRREGVGVLFGFRSAQDLKDATAVIAEVDAGGLGLPDRDFYLKTDEKSVEQLGQYTEHVKRMFLLLGEPAPRAAADAAAVLEIETALAKATLDRVSRRDPYKVYHKLDRRELAALTPSFSWDAFLTGIDVPSITVLNVSEPDFVKEIETLVHQEDVGKWQAYLRWHLVHTTAPFLSNAFVSENFAFFGKTLGGAQKLQPRWQRCVDETDRVLGEALGKQFVAATFDPAAKVRTLALVGELEGSMGHDIDGLPWMSAETKKRAHEKLAAIANKIGYPDVWRDYSTLTITRGDLVGDVLRANAFEARRRLAKIGKPVDRNDWNMTPPTVNAYYSPSMNDINFPAGILRRPFYDARRDDAVNYGGIGAVIGHEMTHGFDDQGSRFDGRGNLSDWWTPADFEEFKKRTSCVADEYSTFPAGGLKVNGRLTLGENTADNGGVRVSLLAYEASTAGKPHKTLDGLTPEQRFFLGYAQVWCQNATPESERLQVLTNPHSPGRYRADGVVVNMPEFQEAFQCKTGAPMAPENRCHVW